MHVYKCISTLSIHSHMMTLICFNILGILHILMGTAAFRNATELWTRSFVFGKRSWQMRGAIAQ